MQIRRSCPALLILGTLACSDEPRGAILTPSAPEAAATIEIVSGHDQPGKAGESLDEPFIVRVLDTAGQPVADAGVEWRVTAGDGWLIHGTMWSERATSTRTGSSGTTSLTFEPTVLGPSTVTAGVRGRPAVVAFTTVASVLVIGNGLWGYFLPPDGSEHVTVPLGTPVEWVNYWPDHTAHIESTAAPADGTSFDSGPLTKDGRFRFVADVPGTWEFVWYYDEDPDFRGTGSITVDATAGQVRHPSILNAASHAARRSK